MKATVLSSCIVQYIPNPVAHKHSVCTHSRLHRTTPLFLSPFLCLEVSVEMADLSVSADCGLFAAAGSGHTHSVTHTHAARSLSCGDFIREGKIHIRPNCCFSFSADLYSTSLGPRDTAVSIHSGAECRHDHSGLLSANPANERTDSDPPGECLWFHVIFSNQTSVRNASFLLSAMLLFMVWFVVISWCCVYDTYTLHHYFLSGSALHMPCTACG